MNQERVASLRRQLCRDLTPEAVAITAKDLVRVAHHGLRKMRLKTPGMSRAEQWPGVPLARMATIDAGRLAISGVDQASRWARYLLDPRAPRGSLAPLPVQEFIDDVEVRGPAFADAGYLALRAALCRLGAAGGLIVERTLRAACEEAALAAHAAAPDARVAAFTTYLAAAMLRRRVIVDVIAGEETEGLAPGEIGRLATVAFCLSLEVASRAASTGDLPPDVLIASCDLCRALVVELRATNDDPAALAAFFARYADHV